MKFKVYSGQPAYTENALKGGNRSAAHRQTQIEHEQLLDWHNLPEAATVIAMPEGPAKEAAIRMLKIKAKLRESAEPKYWNDEVPRYDLSQSSSWVGDIDYDPQANLVTIALGKNGKSKTTYANPEQAAEWVDAGSIGRKVNKELLGRG